ncbi:MAG TPA: hypothetical protein VLJ42_11615 [Solirubrobacteraceae bacterium]|nr:hypothetical protein [Solirubrobacteraceae bacterium]
MPADRSSSPSEPALRNARQEAAERVGARYDVRVLEPSPPASAQEPWFADDPVDPGGRSATVLPLVSPVSNADILWDELVRGDEQLAAWCAERWLGAYPRLAPAPPRLAHTRRALHSLAEHVISPTRQRANGKIGLRYTLGGFGTPFFGNDVQIRVNGDCLIVQVGERVQWGRLTSLADAAEFIGFDLTRFDLENAAAPFDIDRDASLFLGEWFGLAASVLEQLRVEALPEHDASRVQLWPEHFDMSVELGSERAAQRAGYGFSPGDEQHDEPYVYVVPWGDTPRTELWHAHGFDGAELSYAELVAAEQPRDVALAFLRARRDALAASNTPES